MENSSSTEMGSWMQTVFVIMFVLLGITLAIMAASATLGLSTETIWVLTGTVGVFMYSAWRSYLANIRRVYRDSPAIELLRDSTFLPLLFGLVALGLALLLVLRDVLL